MTFLRSAVYAAAAGLFMVPAAQAATLAVYTHDYGVGEYDPAGNDVLGAGFVTVSDNSTSRFSDAFDFSGLAYDSIDRFFLTLNFSAAGPNLLPAEFWSVRVQGSVPAASSDDLFVPLVDALAPQTIIVGPLVDLLTGTDAFAQSLASESFEFWFAESTPDFFGGDSFRLSSATLTIEGTPAAVPLPAAGLLLLGAMGGLAGLRRARKG